MGNLTDEIEFDRVTNFNELKHYKSQNYTTNSFNFKIPKKILLHQNIRDLISNKLDEIFVSLSANYPDIIRVSNRT